MRKLLSVLSVSSVVVLCACAPAPQTQNTPQSGTNMPASIIDPYLAIQDDLANDKIDGIRMNAGNLATAATALGAPAMKIDTAAVSLAAAGDLTDARVKFGTLSEAIVAYKDGLHLKLGDGVKQAFCPMAVKPWLQKGDTLANPYYGSQMPTCGSFTNP
ncbi:MAG TPA: hypothetical protein VFA59_00955 [Vicinamibacterales bacterium]|nr:hypothetical protein [Vicinamibacterales bacterium]